MHKFIPHDLRPFCWCSYGAFCLARPFTSCHIEVNFSGLNKEQQYGPRNRNYNTVDCMNTAGSKTGVTSFPGSLLFPLRLSLFSLHLQQPLREREKERPGNEVDAPRSPRGKGLERVPKRCVRIRRDAKKYSCPGA